MTIRLTPDAAAKLAALNAALAALGLTPRAALALTLAEDVATDANDNEYGDGTVDGVLSSWQEDGHEAWADVLCEVPAFLTDAA